MPQTSHAALGAALADGWLSIAGASVRAALVLPMLVGPYHRLLALRGARICVDQAPARHQPHHGISACSAESGPEPLAQTRWICAFVALNLQARRWRKRINRIAKIIRS